MLKMSTNINYANGSIGFYINNVLIEELQGHEDNIQNTTYIIFNTDTGCTEYWVSGEKIRETQG